MSNKLEKIENIEHLAEKALIDNKFLNELLEGVYKKCPVKFNCFKVLLMISEKHPEVLYTKWSLIEEMTRDHNQYLKYIGVHLITNLVKIDKKNKFEKVFDEFCKMFYGKRAMMASITAGSFGKIARAKPKLKNKITKVLLEIDEKSKSKQKELVKAYAIQSFDEYFENINNKNKIIKFVRKQLNSKSPKTRKKAKEFLKKWDK
jgi:hypothetical protein